jgi:N-acetylglucosaminyldiphosphoundecaprenol N-acetyl-beta-D-mannosaminyltransferase
MSERPDGGEPGEAATQIAQGAARSDDVLQRDVYCILGLPVDAIEMPEVLRGIEAAAGNGSPFLISTINANFLVTSTVDVEFRESVLVSDLCPADGMPIIWIARLLGVPIKHRVAGSDVFETLKTKHREEHPLKVFLFGGADGAAAAAAQALNERPNGLRCVGSICPGFGSVNDMSTDAIIDAINASRAGFLVVSLGAQKGQLWLLRNHRRLLLPVRAHLGAVINFTNGAIKRAPPILRKLGLEWLWRIKEEPQLWRRYSRDGAALIRLLFTRVLPLAVVAQWRRLSRRRHDLAIEQTRKGETITLRLSGFATERCVVKAASVFRAAVAGNRNVVIELTDTRFIDCRFFGLLLMLRKQLQASRQSLEFIGISRRLARLFRLNGVEFLLANGQGV